MLYSTEEIRLITLHGESGATEPTSRPPKVPVFDWGRSHRKHLDTALRDDPRREVWEQDAESAGRDVVP